MASSFFKRLLERTKYGRLTLAHGCSHEEEVHHIGEGDEQEKDRRGISGGIGATPRRPRRNPGQKNPGAISKDHFFSSVATEHLCRINSRRAKRRNERRNGRD